MDLFVTAIPGSFNVELLEKQSPNTNFSTGMLLVFRPSPRIRTVPNPFTHVHLRFVSALIQGECVVRELSRRLAHLLGTCKNRGLFESDELWQRWRKCTRACVEITEPLVCCTHAELSWFGDIDGEIGSVEKSSDRSSKIM